MSDILIKNMEMPKYCLEVIGENYRVVKICPFRELCIRKWGGYIGALDVHSDACPLVALPEHGRLIDADLFYKSLIDLHKPDNLSALDIYNAIIEAPTVLEATE